MTDYVSRSTLKSEYGLTDKLIKLLGKPDKTTVNPVKRSSSPMQLFERTRVETWIADHTELVAESQKRRSSAQKAVKTKRNSAQQEVLDQLRSLNMRPTPPRHTLESQVRDFILSRYGDNPAMISEKAFCSFIRHNYTNYEAILATIQGKVGTSALYDDIKVYLCCEIIKRYGLQLDPYTAAWGEWGEWSQVFDGDIEALQARILATLERGER